MLFHLKMTEEEFRLTGSVTEVMFRRWFLKSCGTQSGLKPAAGPPSLPQTGYVSCTCAVETKEARWERQDDVKVTRRRNLCTPLPLVNSPTLTSEDVEFVCYGNVYTLHSHPTDSEVDPGLITSI